jgi:hypothetical protein
MSFKLATEASTQEYSYNLVDLGCSAAPEQTTEVTKACTKCGEVKGLESFQAKKTGKFGRHAKCRNCVSVEAKVQYEIKAASNGLLERRAARKSVPTERTCSKCQQSKSVENFDTEKRCKWGLRAECKTCRETQAKQRSAARPTYPEGTTKCCTTCQTAKLLAEFHNAVKGGFGKQAQCAGCANAYYSAYAKANPATKNTQSAKRRVARTKRAPLLRDDTRVREFYASAAALSSATGGKHNVDHLIPLQGKLASGLHNHFNLRVVTELENKSKSNRFNLDAYIHTIPQATGQESLALWACLAPHRTQTHG